MIRAIHPLWLLAGVVMLARPASAQANQMPNGLWHGWLQQPDQDSIRVSYDVSHSGKHILITMRGRSGVNYEMDDAKVKHNVLTFDWDLGMSSILSCRLSRRNGRDFEGVCDDRSPGETGEPVHVWMLMTAPDSSGGAR